VKFYLELNDGSGRFESVTKYVFDNRRYALDNEGNARYTDNFILVDGTSVCVTYDGPANTLGVICRMLGQEVPKGAAVGGFYDEPEFIPFKKGQSRFLYQLETDTRWKKAA